MAQVNFRIDDTIKAKPKAHVQPWDWRDPAF